MSGFVDFISGLGLADWCFILLGWLFIAAALGTFTGLGIDLADKRKPKPDPVFRIVSMYPPAVPWPNKRPPVDDAEWLSIWPSAVDDDELCNAEFESLINSNFLWPWPNSEDAA